MFLISNAYAGSTTTAGTDGTMSMFIMLAGFAVIFYFLVWRPQNERAKEHLKLMNELKKGDEVVTNGGILGLVTKTSDDFVTISIADGIEIKIQKNAITATLPKGTLKSI